MLNIGGYINYKKASFNKLFELFDKKVNSDMLIILSLDEIIRPLFNIKFYQDIGANSLTDEVNHLSSLIVNTVGYYRSYFKSRHDKNTHIFILDNYNYNYKPDHRTKRGQDTVCCLELQMLDEYVKSEIVKAKIILDFLPNTNILTVKRPEFCYVPSLITRFGLKQTLIVSADPLYNQFISDSVSILIPKGENTLLIDKNSIGELISKKKPPKDIDYNAFKLASILNGSSKVLGVSSFPLNKTYNLVKESYKGSRLCLYPDICNSADLNKIEMLAEADSIISKNNNLVISSELEVQIINKKDESSLKLINDKIYHKYPIILTNIM
jgi:hypothetical protein